MQDRILIVESDPIISDLISRQTLQSAGYQTFVVTDGSSAIARAMQLAPDVIITNLHTPGLSGKDLLVALSSQRMDIPVIVVASPGMEADVIQAFRLGAADYLLLPLREAEVLQAVERILRQVHERRDRERLERQLQKTNQELQQRVRELTAIFSIGKAVTSITDQGYLFDKILEGAVNVTQADMGWLMLKDESSNNYLLVGQNGLPPAMAARINQPWEDGISSLVAISGESLSLHGDPVKRFKISALGQAVLIVPVKVIKQVMGLLVMVRRQAVAFSASEQNLLEAVADYASISLVNARLFRVVEQRARAQQIAAENALLNEKITETLLESVLRELQVQLSSVQAALDGLSRDTTRSLNLNRRKHIHNLQSTAGTLGDLSMGIKNALNGMRLTHKGESNLADLLGEAVNRFAEIARKNKVAMIAKIPSAPVMVPGTPAQLVQVLDGLLSNATKFSLPGGRVLVQLETTPDRQAQVMVVDTGPGLQQGDPAAIFEPQATDSMPSASHFGGLGISLPLVKQIITSLGGKIWAESRKGQGTCIYFVLPLLK